MPSESNAVAEALKGVPTLGIKSPPQSVQAGSKQSTGLKFDFSSIQAAPPPSKPQTETAKALATGPALTMSFKNAFDAPRETNKADVMRLTALVDDLNSRCKKANDRALAAETQLSRTQATLSTERSNAHARYNVLMTQLNSAKANEAALVKKLDAANATQVASKQKFEQAVAATLAADEDASKKDATIIGLQAELENAQKKVSMVTEELIELNSKNKAMDEAMRSMQVGVDSESSELKAAIAERDIAVKQRDAVSEQLAEAVSKSEMFASRLSAAEEAARQATEVACAPPLTERVDQGEEVKAVEDTEEEEEENVTMVTRCAPPLEAKTELTVSEVTAELSKSSVVENACPIKMHARYEKLRERVMELSTRMQKLEASNCSQERIDKVKLLRDKAYVKAVMLKASYDKIFGAYEPAPKQKPCCDTEVKATPEPEPTCHNAPPQTYILFGERPLHSSGFGKSIAYKMASTSVHMGAAMNQTLHDCHVTIGEAMVDPSAEPKEPDLMGEEEPTGRHDTTEDLVSAVIEDLSMFLKNANEEAPDYSQPRFSV